MIIIIEDNSPWGICTISTASDVIFIRHSISLSSFPHRHYINYSRNSSSFLLSIIFFPSRQSLASLIQAWTSPHETFETVSITHKVRNGFGNLRIDERQVEGRQVRVLTRQSNEHSAIRRRVTSEGGHIWLDSSCCIATDVDKRDVGGIKLGYEHRISRRISQRRTRRDVAVVRSHGLVDVAPRE